MLTLHGRKITVDQSTFKQESTTSQGCKVFTLVSTQLDHSATKRNLFDIQSLLVYHTCHCSKSEKSQKALFWVSLPDSAQRPCNVFSTNEPGRFSKVKDKIRTGNFSESIHRSNNFRQCQKAQESNSNLARNKWEPDSLSQRMARTDKIQTYFHHTNFTITTRWHTRLSIYKNSTSKILERMWEERQNEKLHLESGAPG